MNRTSPPRSAQRVRSSAEIPEPVAEITGVKVNPRTGLPAISPYAVQQLIVAAADLERKALGVELLPTEEMAQLSAPTVDVTPLGEEHQALLRRMGDYLAQQSLQQAPLSITLSLDDAGTPQETPASEAE